MSYKLDAMRYVLLGLQDSATMIYHNCGELCKELQKMKKDMDMDKQIKKVSKSIEKAEKSLDKGEKDTKKLMKMDKVQDKKIEKCAMKGKKK
jgi:hypothetical protein